MTGVVEKSMAATMTPHFHSPHRPVGHTGINRSVDAALAGRAMRGMAGSRMLGPRQHRR